MKGMILRLLFSEFHRQTCKVCHKLAKIKTTKEGEEEEVFSLANFSKSSLSWSVRAKELTDGERGPKWFDQLLPHLLILSERSAGIIICHMLWHAGITLFVMACRAAGTVERSGEKIPRGGGEWGGVSTGVGVLCILNAAQRFSGGVLRRAETLLLQYLMYPAGSAAWRSKMKTTLKCLSRFTRGGYQWEEVG